MGQKSSTIYRGPLSFLPGGPPMKAKIRTRERCVHGCVFAFDEIRGFHCPAHGTFPRRYFLYLHWENKRYNIYHDQDGGWLDSYKRAQLLQASIEVDVSKAIAGPGIFNAKRFLKADQRKYWIMNLLDDFLPLKTYRPSCRKDYKRYYDRAKGFFKTKDIRKLENAEILDYLRFLEKGKISLKTQKNYLDALRTFVIWCREDRGMRMENLTKWPKIKPVKAKRRWISQADQIDLLQYIEPADQPIVLYTALHGTRLGESRAIRIRDVDLKNRLIVISGTFSGNVYMDGRKGQDSEPYEVPIRDEIYDWIADLCKEALPGAFLFVNQRNGQAYSQQKMRRIWAKVREGAGLVKEFRLYDATRHSFASQLRAAGVDIADVRDHLGHKDIRTTLRYAHGSVEKLRANLKKLSLGKVIPLTVPKPDQEAVAIGKR